MKVIYTDRILSRLEQLFSEIENSFISSIDFHDRLRELRHYCNDTSALANCLAHLPATPYDLHNNSLNREWPTREKGYATRWSAISQIVDMKPRDFITYCNWIASNDAAKAHSIIIQQFVYPIYHYLVDQLQASSIMLYTILRYKRWVEWFEADILRQMYETNGKNGEDILDENLRRFLFESGVDYPFSQPASPRGRVDVVAGLETDDPLVLEIKVWDSRKSYKENRICDGLRQVMEYATQYGKDKGYIIVFNLDQGPLSFISPVGKGEWPPRVESGGRTYFFIDIHIAEKLNPISQQDKGKLVHVNEINLVGLLDNS